MPGTATTSVTQSTISTNSWSSMLADNAVMALDRLGSHRTEIIRRLEDRFVRTADAGMAKEQLVIGGRPVVIAEGIDGEAVLAKFTEAIETALTEQLYGGATPSAEQLANLKRLASNIAGQLGTPDWGALHGRSMKEVRRNIQTQEAGKVLPPKISAMSDQQNDLRLTFDSQGESAKITGSTG